MIARRQGAHCRVGGRGGECLARLVLVVLALTCWPSLAQAGPPAMIPPGQESAMRELVRAALADAERGGELPMPLAERVDIHVARDHFRVVLHARHDTGQSVPALLIHHPEAFAGAGEARGGRVLAPGVGLRCADAPCSPEQAEPWRALAERLAAGRAPVVDAIWRLREQSKGPSVELGDEAGQRRQRWLVDRVLVVLATILGAGLWIAAGLRERDSEQRARWPELLALAALVAAYVGAALRYTAMLPLHEHNSFVARSDCAVSPHCISDPVGAWNLGALNGYGLLLEQLPDYGARGLAQLSLLLSALTLVLCWALARVLVRRLGHGRLAPLAGLSAVLVWVTHPVAWRLGSSASFWPWALVWTLAAALAGLWAGEQAQRGARGLAWLAWQFAALALVLATGGNYVLLTLASCVLLAPLAWSSAWDATTPADRRSWLRAGLVATPTLALVACLSWANYAAGLQRMASDSLGEHLALEFGVGTLLLDGRVGTRVWGLAALASLAWLFPGSGGATTTSKGRERWRGLRLLTPLLYACCVPGVFLAAASGDVLGSGYPVGFISHHWELCFSALGTGLGLAWLAASLEQRWPQLAGLADTAPAPLRRVAAAGSWTLLLPLVCTLLALLQNPRSEEGWRLATGSRVVERELLALEQAFAQLPPHELLLIAPRLMQPMSDAASAWDPLEVNFPVHTYEQTMRKRGLEPARVLPLDRVELEQVSESYDLLIYVGSALRSFQPHELEAGVVSESLERAELLRLREHYALEAVLEFTLTSAQHEAISMRLGADRHAELELGFYRLRRVHRP